MKIPYILLRVLILLIFIEVSLRILKPDALEYYRIQKQIHTFDSDYLVDLEPNVDVRIKQFQGRFDIKFITNSKGYRSKEIDSSLPQIGCIGDSVTMGFGVSNDDTFCNLLDGYKDKAGNTYRTVNLGVDAYGPSAIERKLERHLPNLNLKLLYYFPSNGDDIDELNFYSKINNPNSMFFFKTQFLASKYSYFILAVKITQEQLIYRFKETFIYPIWEAKKIYKCMTDAFPEFDCSFTDWNSLGQNLISDFFKKKPEQENRPPVFGPNECQEQNDPYFIPETVFASTRKIVELSKKYNFKLVLFLSPIDIETAYCSQQNRAHRFYNYSMSLKQFLINEKIDFVDLNTFTYEMVDENGIKNPRPYYIIGDGHYTKIGNYWVYNRLKEKTGQIIP